MKNLHGKNGEFESLAGKLLAADKIGADELNAIVSKPYLLSSVRSRIAAEKAGRPSEGLRSSLMRQMWLKTAFAAAVAVFATVGFFALQGTRGSDEVTYVQPPPADDRIDFVEQIEPPAPAAEADVQQDVDPPAAPQRRVEAPATSARLHVPRRVKKPRRATVEKPPLEFYALASMGDPSEAVKGGRIVRVDLPKTSLLALGVNVPLETGQATVKTDLLVGADGVPRAIRLVE